MPVFHLTLHAYNSWNADNPNGWYQHGVKGKRFPAPGVAEYRDDHACWDEVHFADSEHGDLLLMARDISDRRTWRIHAILISDSHIHIIASWTSSAQAEEVKATFKRLLGLKLAKMRALPGRRWFSRGGKPEQVKNQDHLTHLIHVYLPSHRGTFWSPETGMLWCAGNRE